MYLKHLAVSNFKNIEQLDIDCSSVLNCFEGNNGEGKTNLLDGIYYLSMCKSKFLSSDYPNIRDNEDYFLLKARYSDASDDGAEIRVSCGIKRNGKKSFKCNDKEYKKLSEHIGVIPLVFVTPSDSALITDGSEERRKFLNSVISQTDKPYLDALMRYNNLLANRNKLLKNKSQPIDRGLMETLNEQMARYGTVIFAKRQSLLETLNPVFNEIYAAISGEKESVNLSYRSDLSDGKDLKRLLDETADRDRILQYTSTGVHRDDLIMTLNGRPLKYSGSQGQQKTCIIAMKMAQFRIIQQSSGVAPLLLLDDIFDKLDTGRVERLIAFVSGKNFGQIFLTDSNKNRLDVLLQATATDYKLFNVSAGNVTLIQSSDSRETQ